MHSARSHRRTGVALLAALSVAWLLGGGARSTARGQEGSRIGRYQIFGDTGNLRTLPSGERVSILVGNVRFLADDLDLSGHRGRYYRDARRLEVVGSVIAVTESLTLRCDSLEVLEARDEARAFGAVTVETADGVLGSGRRGYYRESENALALAGRARVIDRLTMVEGDSIALDRDRGFMEAFGSVKVVDEINRSVVTGQHGTYDRRRGLAVIDSLPELRSRRGTGPATSVTSRWMSFDRSTRHSTAIGDVRFQQGATRAHADTARFAGEDLLVLTGSPSVEQEGRVMTGAEIVIHYVEGALRRIEVHGDASLVDSSPDTLSREFSSVPLSNTLEGDSLRIDVEDGEIVRTFVRGRASSVYLPEDQEKTVSVNEVAGESIDIRFVSGRVGDVTVLGKVSGTYRFLERASMRADSTAVVSPDGPARPGVRADSLVAAADSAATDSVRVRSRLFDFSTRAQTVRYEGDRTYFDVPAGRIDVGGKAAVRHGTLELYAEEVRFDTRQRELLAEGDPRLVDRESELIGDRMGYLFDARTGAVNEGATRFDDGFYYGRHIRRTDEKTLLVSGGTYTTCDLEDPHYHFYAKRMKLRVGESVVARQVTLHISDIPLITLPFYYKKIDSGRHSGILFPNVNLGVSSREGRYVRDLGYYWATNEYTDFAFEMDYNERREATFQVQNEYRKRYSFDGSARFEYLRRFSRTEQGDEWKLSAQHNQPELWESWRANARAEISSKNVTRSNLSGNSNNDLIDSRLYSTASLSRSFDSGASLGLSAARTQYPNAEDDDRIGTNNRLSELSLPLRLSFKTRPLLGGRRRGDDPWYANTLRDVNFSQNYSTTYDQRRNEESEEDVVSAAGNFSLSYAPTQRLGPFRLTSSANFAESWRHRSFDRRVYREEQIAVDDSTTVTVVVLDEDASEDLSESESTPSLSFSNRLGTDLYGIFDTSLGPVRGVKHKMSWSATHNYRPRLGSKQTSSQDIGLSLGNEFSLKVRDGDAVDEDGRPKTRKLNQLLTWNLATSVDPDADPGKRWSDIRSDLRVRPGITQAISFSMGQNIDPYTLEVKSTRFNSDLRMRGGLDLLGTLSERSERKNSVVDRLPAAAADTASTRQDARNRDPDGFADATEWLDAGDRNSVPWDLYLRGSLTQTRSVDGSTVTRSNLSAQANVGLPGQWRLSWSADIDTESGEFTNQFWRLSRPVHCWRLEFSRGLADGQDFGFSFYLDQIPDLRIDRGDRARGGDFGSRVSSF